MFVISAFESVEKLDQSRNTVAELVPKTRPLVAVGPVLINPRPNEPVSVSIPKLNVGVPVNPVPTIVTGLIRPAV